MIRVADSYTVDASGLTLTRDGYLVGEARIARAGNVQQYYGSELGLTGDDASKVFGVYRDPDIVFNKDSMRSLAGRPITRNHPSEQVTAKNWKDLAKGAVGGVISRDGEHVVASMAIMDASAVEELKSNPGARALSAGYTVDIERADGVAPDGTPYQYKQSGELRFNHVAYLPGNNPRAGNTRIGDQGNPDIIYPAQPTEGGHMADSNLRKVMIDGLSVETTEQGAQAIEKLTKQVGDAQAANVALADSHKAEIAAKDTEIGELTVKLKDAEAKILADSDLDARVAERAELVSKAKAIVDADYTGKSDAEIRKSVVAAKLGDATVAGKSDEFVAGCFAMLDSATDPVRQAVKDGVTTVQVKDNGYAASVAALNPKKEA